MDNKLLLDLIAAEDSTYKKHQQLHHGFLFTWCVVLFLSHGIEIPSLLFWVGNLAAICLHLWFAVQREILRNRMCQLFVYLAKNLDYRK